MVSKALLCAGTNVAAPNSKSILVLDSFRLIIFIVVISN